MLGDKKVLYSGMQSTGNLTLGNYLGCLLYTSTDYSGWAGHHTSKRQGT